MLHSHGQRARKTACIFALAKEARGLPCVCARRGKRVRTWRRRRTPNPQNRMSVRMCLAAGLALSRAVRCLGFWRWPAAALCTAMLTAAPPAGHPANRTCSTESHARESIRKLIHTAAAAAPARSRGRPRLWGHFQGVGGHRWLGVNDESAHSHSPVLLCGGWCGGSSCLTDSVPSLRRGFWWGALAAAAAAAPTGRRPAARVAHPAAGAPRRAPRRAAPPAMPTVPINRDELHEKIGEVMSASRAAAAAAAGAGVLGFAPRPLARAAGPRPA